MEQKQRFFIYDRKEMGVLTLLGVMVAVFAFTLGVHLGKKVATSSAAPVAADAGAAPTVADKVPNRQELTEQAKGVQQAVDETLNQALHDEVARTGIKMDAPRQVDLPEGTRSGNAGATTASKGPALDFPAALRASPEGKFTLQIGSYPALEDARDQVDAIEALGLRPFLRPADIKGKGKWYRVYIGGFASKDAAAKAGEHYRNQHVIDTFIVSRMTD